MKKGDKLICKTHIFTCYTKGKEYEVFLEDKKKVIILDDENEYNSISKKSLEQNIYFEVITSTQNMTKVGIDIHNRLN
jgi:hypothetical protein